MRLTDAQENMCDGYLNGGPGMLASGIVWLTAGFVALFVGMQASVFTLFIGGMFIHPAGQQLAKLFGRSGTHAKDNPLALLALEGTVLLFVGILIAYVIVQTQPLFFFPIMLLTIGGRYLTFQTIYGLRFYWLIGGLLIAAGGVCLVFTPPLPPAH